MLTSHDRREDKEGDDGHYGLLQQVDLRCVAILLRVGDVVARERRDEDGANAHGAEPPGEERLAERLDVGDPPVEREDGREAAEEKNEESDDDETPGREAKVVKVLEGDDGADVDERGAVEEQVDDVGEHRVLCRLVEVPVPRKRTPTRERGKQIVGAQERADADGEKGERDILRDIRLTVDELLALRELHDLAGGETEHPADQRP